MPSPFRSRRRRTPRRRAAVALTALAAGLTLVACGTAAPYEYGSAGPSPSPTPTPAPTPEPEPLRWPLTGVLAEELPERPAVAVKIENTASARPQSGLEAADVVWETIVEFDVPRLIAVYHSQTPTEVGPVRSVRPMDVRVVQPLGGVLTYSGGQPGILDLVPASGIQGLSFDAGQGGMYRVGHRSAPHNVYGSVETFAAAADDAHRAAPAEQFAFADDAASASAAAAGQGVTSLAVSMSPASYPSWTWDPPTATWLRSEAGTPAVSAAGARLAATNVVVVEVESFDSGFDAQLGAPVPDLRLEGTGRALVATGGKVLEGTWAKAGAAAPLTLHTAAGQPLLLAPGTTWVELMPLGRSWELG